MQGFFSKSKLLQQNPTNRLSIPKCGICGLKKKSQVVEPIGEGQKGILIIGQTPDNSEFDRLKKICKTQGINLLRDCIITHACKCVTEQDELSDIQIEACRANVFKNIHRLKPKVVILLGLGAVKSVLGHIWKDNIESVNQWVGFQIPSDDYKAFICPTYHPSYLDSMEDRTLELLFKRHIIKALKKVTNSVELPNHKLSQYKNEITIIRDIEKIKNKLKQFIDEGGWQAFDFETNTMKPETRWSKIVSCSISTGDETIAFLFKDEIIETFKEYISSPNIKKIASNLKFEDRWCRVKLNCKVRNWGWDTMLAAHTIDSRRKITGLKFQVFANFGIKDYNSHIEPFLKCESGKINRIEEIDTRDLLLYNGLDSLFEYKLCLEQFRRLK